MRDRSETPPHAAPGPVRLSVPTFPTPAATRPRQASAPPDTPPDAPPDPPGPRVSAVQLRFRTDAIDDALA
ncbi:MAG TPA: hypothetical protein VNA89_02505, partial [Gemmatimonadaceae bacterium]|nr:hypothetical protein [Gemmatimonadaceae bacterium]